MVVGPHPEGYAGHWVTRGADGARHRFTDVLAPYKHDSQRPRTSARQWLDVVAHARAGVAAARREGAGIVTLFPQLAVAVGLLARGSLPHVAWSFNVGRAPGAAMGAVAGFALRRGGPVVVHARREAATYAAAFRLPESRFRFVPFSVPRADPTLEEDDAEPFVLAMGSANRDYAGLFQAARGLPLRVMVVAGAHAVAGLDVPPNVVVRAGLSFAECRELTQRARLSVVPLREGFGASGQVTVIEAMVMGRPVVATRTLGTEDYVRDGDTGALVPPGDVAALRDALMQLWEDAAMRARLAAAARAQALAEFTHEAAAAKLLDLCDEAAL